MDTRPRLQDVAARAGVSLTTASHAFSGRRPVSARTKAAVLKAAFDLGFVADARSPRPAVGLLLRPPEAVPGFAAGTASFAALSGAVMVALLGAGYSVSSFLSLDEIGDQVGRLDAFVLLHPNRQDAVLRALVQRGIPTISYDPDPGDGAFPWWVGPDYAASTRAMLRHLDERGARRPALIVGSTRNMYMTSIAAVYLREMQRRGLPPLVRELDPESAVAGGRAATESLLGLREPPDALLTTSGVFAVGAIEALEAAGARVPDDALVATMMDGTVAESHRVPVTAMRSDVHASADRVAALLRRRLAGEPPPPERSRLDLELVARGSTLRDGGGRPPR